jgi:ubiquinone/menaquinone biosynthesis C-methylase UbiE
MPVNLPFLIRKAGLIKAADRIRYYVKFIGARKQRRQFRKENPGVVLPPPYSMYETFNLNYTSFYNKSIDTAAWLVSHLQKHKTLDHVNILDWGCGPGRIIRHLPGFLPDSCEFYGTDYNAKYIKWCRDNLEGICFKTNQLVPPLDFDDQSMDVIYGISIFTHLSEEMHFAWFNELMRVLKPRGILFITLQGKAFIEKLDAKEKTLFDNGQLVIKAKTKEGHRTYAAFQPEAFVRKMAGSNEMADHIPGKIKDGMFEQDVWIIRKTI